MFSLRIPAVLCPFAASLLNIFRFSRPTIVARRIAATGMMLVLIGNHALSGPVPMVITSTLKDLGEEMRFRWYSDGWAKIFNHLLLSRSADRSPKGWDGNGSPGYGSPPTEVTERKEERERRVAGVKIYPGDVKIETGQQVVFTAVAYDRNGAAISGLDYNWRLLDEEKDTRLSLSPRGVFSSATPGRFRLMADVAGHRSQIEVTVEGMERNRMLAGQRIGTFSSRDPLKKSAGPDRSYLLASAGGMGPKTSDKLSGRPFGRKGNDPAAQIREQTRASATPLTTVAAIQSNSFSDTWNGTNIQAADNPGMERGNPPGRAINTGMGSGNFQFEAPIISLGGRAIDLNLDFHYNSRLWSKINNYFYFNIDRDWIPGWSLGFGKIIVAGNSYVLFEGDGTRHSYTGAAYSNFPGEAGALQSFEGYTTDGTFINYYAEGYMPHINGGLILKAWAKLPNGTTIDYGAPGYSPGKTGAIYPVQITDANGNYISITYRNNQGPEIETITDSLGRVIQFHYDGNNLPVAITAPGLRDDQGNSQPRVLVRLAYETKNLVQTGYGYGFLPRITIPVVSSSTFTAIRAIYYPATGTGYWFGDPDSYSPYGMIRKVSERRGMSCSAGGGDCASAGASLNQQAAIGAGLVTHEKVYSHPTSPGYSYPHISGLLREVPTFTQMTEDWAARAAAAPPVTYFSTADSGTTKILTITRPDGARVEQFTDNNPNSPTYGQVLEDRTYADASNPNPISTSRVGWEIGDYGSLRPARVEVADDRGQWLSTVFSYGPVYNQVVDARQYGYYGNLLRRTHTEYENDAAYRGSLIKSGTLWWHPGGALYDGPQWSGPHIFNLVKVTEIYASDDATREARTEFRYDQSTPESTPGVVQHKDAPEQRGNLTSITRYANAAVLDGGTAVVETRGYDVCGNVIRVSASCCEQTTFEFTANTQYAWPEVTTSGSATDAAQQNMTRAVYDFNTGVVKESYDTNGRRSVNVYYPNTLRPQFEYSPTGAYSYHTYDDTALALTDYLYEAGKSGGNFATRIDKYIDGMGRVQGEVAYGKGGALDIVETRYDNLGRLWQQTRPFRYGSAKYWSTYEYDRLDRVTRVIAPDGSTIQRFYNEPNYPGAATPGVPGQTIRIKDPWGRERWARFDEQNRLVEIVEADPNGNGATATGGLRTNYTYNALGNLLLVKQGVQTRRFQYDSLSRLTHQKLAERDATLDDDGQYVGAGQWSEVFGYDTKSNVAWRSDARGVKTYYIYNNDPLSRLQGVQYDKSGVPSALAGNIPDAPNVSYAYVTTGDKLRVRSIRVDGGMGDQTFSYDSEGRLAQATQTFTGRENYPLVTSYLWDTLDRTREISYPKTYGADNSSKSVVPTYDMASRFDSLKFDGMSLASNFVYDASSQAISLNVGMMTEKTLFDDGTGLPVSQQVVRGTETLLDLRYNYTLNNDPNNKGAKTGQLTGLTDLRNQARNRAYEYDRLGRLRKVKGGANAFNSPAWSQGYSYDRYGNKTTAANTGDEVWVDDSLPAGATPGSDGGDSWMWTASNPGPYSGSASSRSNIAQGEHQHFFLGATETLQVKAGDRLYAYVYLDPANIPSEVMLQWNDGTWNHRAYWGANNITGWGVDGTESLRYMGALPAAGGWVKLEVPASAVGLEGKTVNGMAFTLYGGRANWDRAGKYSSTPSPMPADGLANLSYNPSNNRITNAGFEYDAAGNQTRAVVDTIGEKLQYRYDSAGRLAQVLNNDGQVVAAYNYGASNQRLKSVEGGITTYYSWDGDRVIAEYEAAGTDGLRWRTSYIYLGDRLLATQSSEGTRFHHQDRLGTRLVTDSSNGEIVTEQLTLPFGTTQQFGGALGGNNSWQHPTKSNPSKKQFTSYDRSFATGLDYAVNRSYSTLQGRFTQVDPIEMDSSNLGNPQTFNLYAYCGNDPVNSIDPDGLLFGFLKNLFKGIAKVVKAIVKVVKIVALAVTTAFAVITFNVPLLIQAGLGLFSEFGSNSFRRIAGFAGGILGAVSGGGLGGFKTPGIASGGTSVGGVSNFMQRAKRLLPRFYREAKDAFIRFIGTLNRNSRDLNIEFAGSICRTSSGNVYATSPIPGTSDSSSPGGCAIGETKIATYHTHANYDPRLDQTRRNGVDYNEVFSADADIPNADARGVPSFLATPKRRIKVYIPNSSIYAGPDVVGGRTITLKERTR